MNELTLKLIKYKLSGNKILVFALVAIILFCFSWRLISVFFATIHLRNYAATSSEIDAKTFWSLRDATSGHFAFDPTNVFYGTTHRISTTSESEIALHQFFAGSRLTSSDRVITEDRANQILEATKSNLQSDKKVLQQSSSHIVYEDVHNHQVHILFVKSIHELMLVDGLFDFLPYEVEMLRDKTWLNQTEINFHPMLIKVITELENQSIMPLRQNE